MREVRKAACQSMCKLSEDSPIRILHIVGSLDLGGLETFLLNTYHFIDRSKVQFDFLVSRNTIGAYEEEIKALGGNIYHISALREKGFREVKKELDRFFDEHTNYHIVHCHRDALCAFYLRVAKKHHIAVRIAHSHNTQIIEESSLMGYATILVKNYWKLLTRRYATHYFACGERAGEWLFGKYLRRKPVYVIKNGIRAKEYDYRKSVHDEVRRTLGISEEILLLGHVGRFNLQKNHHFLIKLFSELKEEVPNSKLCLVGQGNLEEEIRGEVQRLGLSEDVYFLGSRRDVSQLMQGFDLFVLPSLFEGLPVVLVEAQASGLKCLIADTISKEADFGLNLVSCLPITTTTPWIEAIKAFNNELKEVRANRKSDLEGITKAGYNSQASADKLQQFYLTHWGE